LDGDEVDSDVSAGWGRMGLGTWNDDGSCRVDFRIFLQPGFRSDLKGFSFDLTVRSRAYCVEENERFFFFFLLNHC
jgi:hypothetical protein